MEMQTKRYHCIFDMQNCNASTIGNAEIMEKFIKDLANAIEMNILKGPIVAEGIPENPGLSALAIIDYSHISIHTFTKFNEVLIDVFSCKPYDKFKALAMCNQYFATDDTTVSDKEVWWG